MRRAVVLAFVCAAAAAAPRPARAEAAHGGFLGDMDCSACHTPDGWALSPAAGASGFDHDRTGFPLRGAHVTTPCTGCHRGTGAPARECKGCHRDGHQGRLGPFCAECHGTASWSDTQARARHRMTRMPLTGRHALIECTACHRRTSERTYSELPSDCFACHAADYRRDIHPDHDGNPADPSQAAFPRDCGRCHRTSGWTPAVIDPGSLARMAAPAGRRAAPAGHDLRFVLSTGKHRGAACESCHLDLARPRLVSCGGCHAHDAATLRRQHRVAVFALSAASCLRCHPGGGAR